MLTNYIKVALRILIKHKMYFLINSLGLALGICACIVIYLLSSYEFSFDTFHPDKERIYRLGGKVEENNGRTFYVEDIPSPAPGAIHDEIPGIEAITSFYPYTAQVTIQRNAGTQKFDNKTNSAGTKEIVITDPDYFSIFQYEWLAGSPQTALRDPFKVVLSQSIARKYFGPLQPDQFMGKELIYQDSLRVTVSGIVRDWEHTSDFTFRQFISLSTIQHSFLKGSYKSGWNPGKGWAWSLVKLSKGKNIKSLQGQLSNLVKKHMKADSLNKFSLQLEPLSDVHFNSNYEHDGIRKAHLPTLYSLMFIALFILLIAAINYANLATAHAIQRTKEIGIRTVLGGSRANLVLQFLTEALTITLLGTIIGACLVRVALYLFRDFIPSEIVFNIFNASTILFLGFVTGGTCLLAGLYPAKVLSSHLLVITLQGNTLNRAGRSLSLRRILIVFQFSLSLIFIISCIVITDQIQFMRFSDLGFKTDAIITINNWSDDERKMKLFGEKLKELPGIADVILQGKAPAFVTIEEPIIYKGPHENAMMVHMQAGDERFVPFYGIKIIAGRNLMHSDSLKECLINETYSRSLGFQTPGKAIGQILYRNNILFPIAGVVADFHEGSFHETIGPTVIGHMPELSKSIAIKLAVTENEIPNLNATLALIKNEWKYIYPTQSFSYSFLNDEIAQLYEYEAKTAKLIKAAMFIAVFISCMGLLGLVMFTVEKRTKEIGIRKVLGASIAGILGMLSKEIFILIVIALLIATPIAWYFMHRWLQDFAYRINISWWIFAVSGVGTLLLALLTIGFQAVKAARANPAESLRTE